MEEERVKVVFDFNKDDYNKYLFLIDQEPDKDTEKAWEVMVKEGINLSTSSIAKKHRHFSKRSISHVCSFGSNGS